MKSFLHLCVVISTLSLCVDHCFLHAKGELTMHLSSLLRNICIIGVLLSQAHPQSRMPCTCLYTICLFSIDSFTKPSYYCVIIVHIKNKYFGNSMIKIAHQIKTTYVGEVRGRFTSRSPGDVAIVVHWADAGTRIEPVYSFTGNLTPWEKYRSLKLNISLTNPFPR